MKKYIFLLIVLFPGFTYAQKNDAVWLLGYGYSMVNNGGMKLTFNNNSIDTSRFQLPFWLDNATSEICDNEGELVAYTNGNLVSNRQHEIMPNGYDINPGKIADSYCIEGRGYPEQSGATMILPKFEGQDFYRLFHLSYRDSGYERLEFLYSDIEINLDDGLGDVTTKNQLVLIDSFLPELSATKHANGRDWWIVIPRRAGNGYYKYLYSPSGLSSPTIQNIGYQRDTYFYWVSQAEFSPDGSKYARANFYNGLDIMDFDRCTGEFSNNLHISPTHELYGVGLSFSPNSRFLYYSTLDSLHQYDMWASDIPASRVTVAVYTGAIEPFGSFYFQKLAPNGKILMSANNTIKYLHIIHHPDLKGDSCLFQETGLSIPFTNGWCLPNFQHYRLGPVDGSACDSLGIDNVPVAKFRYEDDTLNMFHFDFWDLSYYEPQAWAWTFGDGGTSTLRNPSHTYTQEGVYEVCLTVSNSNGSHTFCRELVVGSSSTAEQQEEAQMVLFPNPAQDKVYIQWLSGKSPYQVMIHDMLGRVVYQARWSECEKGILVGHLPLGMYVVLAQDERGKVLSRRKLVKGR